MTDLYAPRRSVLEDRRITEGRARLHAKISAPPYSSGQSEFLYKVGEGAITENRKGRQYDVFTLQGVSGSLHKQWREDERRHGWLISHDSTRVSVPIDYYLARYRLPIDLDGGLAARLLICASVMVLASYIRYAWL